MTALGADWTIEATDVYERALSANAPDREVWLSELAPTSVRKPV